MSETPAPAASSPESPDPASSPSRVVRSGPMRALYVALGALFVGIGVLGVVLPLLPHTVFFLLAAACFARGSERAHRWLMTNHFFGRYLRDYAERRGATVGVKAVTLVMLWGGLALSAWLIDPPVWLYIVLAAVGVGVTTYVLRLATLRD